MQFCQTVEKKQHEEQDDVLFLGYFLYILSSGPTGIICAGIISWWLCQESTYLMAFHWFSLVIIVVYAFSSL